MLNQTILVGRLVDNLEVKKLENGTKVSNITLAIPRSFKNADVQYDTDFVKCTLWNSVAENTAEYCKKGDIVGVKGRVQQKEYENENGKHKELEIIAEKVTFLSSAKEKEQEEPEKEQDDEIDM